MSETHRGVKDAVEEDGTMGSLLSSAVTSLTVNGGMAGFLICAASAEAGGAALPAGSFTLPGPCGEETIVEAIGAERCLSGSAGTSTTGFVTPCSWTTTEAGGLDVATTSAGMRTKSGNGARAASGRV
jgi:hypothetical protein